jgi:preprotein translocase subunit SecG
LSKLPRWCRVGAHVALAAFLLQVPPTALADSGGSGSDSDSAGSSDGSAGSQNSSDGSLGDSSGNSDINEDALSTTTVVATLATTAGIIVLIVLLVKKKKRQEAAEQKRKKNNKKRQGGADLGPDHMGRALVYGEILGAQRDLGMTLNLLARSPSSLDRLEAEALDGHGPLLHSLASALQQPAAAVAEGFRAALSAEGPPVDQAGTNRLVVRILDEAVEDFDLDPVVASDLLWRLERERAHPDYPAVAPLHQRLALALDVPVASVALAVGDTFDLAAAAAVNGSVRASLADAPLDTLDRLADRIEAVESERVAARYAQLVRIAESWDPTGQLELGQVD